MLSEKITVRVDQEIKEKLETLAKKDGRDLSNYIRFLLEMIALVTEAARIAAIQILKEGEDEEISEKYIDIVFKGKKDHLEIDKVAIEKIKRILKGEG